jgi:Polyketide synthase modules and related proteins
MLKLLYFLVPANGAKLDSLGSHTGYLRDHRNKTTTPGGQALVDASTFCAPTQAVATAIGPVFVEYHPAINCLETDTFRQALETQAPGCSIVLVTSDMDYALDLAHTSSRLAAIVFKSCEAAGIGSTETAGILLDNALHRLGPDAPPIGIWGGIATPEAAAAFLATGASFVVIEHAHWLTSGIGLDEGAQQRLRGLKPDSTSVVEAGPGVQWRFFDKGNSRAVRHLRGLTDEHARKAAAANCTPLDQSTLSPDELTPLGVDAAFAAGFVERFGADTGSALTHFTQETLRLWTEAPRTQQSFLNERAAKALGTPYPFIQGGMSWISDSLDFARAVADAGALPTLAVGMRTPELMDRDFASAAKVMDGRPYAMNILVLNENPHRDGQLAWLEKHRPPFVVVAAGSPAFAGKLRKKGLEVIYLAADMGLLRMAAEAGIRFVVLEGCEAGGHVGRLTTLTLAQAAGELRRREPELLRDVHLVLAGGISGGPGALRAAMLGADAVQMGTVYLASREIVATGALSAVYQKAILEAPFASTCISGESVGLRVRALETDKVRAICALEREKARGCLEEDAFRRELETLSTGSLLVAAKGLRTPGGAPLAPDVCRAEGQFMSGAVAANLSRVRPLAEIHTSMANARPLAAPPQEQTAPSPSKRERIAITGMALANSLGDNVGAVIEASLSGKSGIGTVPKERWDHSRYYTPAQVRQGGTYTDVGAFMTVDMPRKALGVSPQDYRTMSLSTKLTLLLARRAVEASGLAKSLVPGARVAVLTSQNSAEVASTVRGQLFNTYADEIGEIAWRTAELTTEQRAAITRELVKEGLAVDDTTLIGRLNCTASGHICNMYGFGGPSYSVGAACASSLIALYNAVLLMRAGVIDAAVVGGGEEYITPVHYLEFSALRALAGVEAKQRTPAEHSRPFDSDRDGFVLGEGGAVVVLERESVARERGATIHALITGVGACTNHQGIVESVAASQRVALEASYADAGYGLDQVDLVECHGTGTIQGDREEAHALASTIGGQAKPGSTVLSSFKSQIGHTLGASGVSSLIRGIGAMRRGLFPPTNNFTHPDPSLGLDAAGFRVLTKAEPWPAPEQRGRRMQVNAFGFGGACVVVQVEAPSDLPDIPCKLPERKDSDQASGASFFTTQIDGHDCRLGLTGPVAGTAELIRAAVAEGMTPATLARLSRKGVFLTPTDEPVQPLSMIFSGQGAYYKGMGRDITRAHPVMAQTLEVLAACAEYDLKNLLFEADEATLRDTRWQQPALFAFEYALASQLLAYGVKPAAVAGHSLGEFTALAVAGVLSPEDAFGIVDMRARCMAKAASLTETPGVMAAIGLPADVLQWKLAKHPGVVITNYNTPKQVVVGGEEASVRALVDEVKSKGQQATLLKVSMAFHSPVMRIIRDEFAGYLAGVEFKNPVIPVLSNVLKGPFPSDPDAIRKTVVEHLESPVHWTQNVYFLWSELGIRRFVEVGPDAILSGMVRDICDEAQTITTASREQEAKTFGSALANLYAWGDLIPSATPSNLDVGLSGADKAAPTAPKPAPSTQQQGATSNMDVLERTIRIIMEATGYERDEIEPDMDLRQDLAIRSSRLPVIMDTAEHVFGLSFHIEKFIGVHTVRQMAERIEDMLAEGTSAPATAQPAALKANAPAPESQRTGPLPVIRYEAGEAPLPPGEALALGDLSEKPAWVLGTRPNAERDEMAQGLAAAYGLTAAADDMDKTPGAARPACLVLILGPGSVKPEDIDTTLLACFRRLKEFIASPARKACVLVLRETPHGAPERVVFEGVLGILLTLAQEYSSIAWRALRVADGQDMGKAVVAALASSGPVERVVRPEGVFTPQYLPKPLGEACAGGPSIRPGDVILASAGAKGVTMRLLEALAPLGPHLVLLGRSPADEAGAEAVSRFKALGAEAEYQSCDVTDQAAVKGVVDEVAARLGRVDGVIHGAGLLRDKFLSMMAEADFEAVCQVKLGGLRNLVMAANPHGLRLVAAFSSVAAWQGNVGQANYCCANRAMASLLAGMNSPGFAAKVLWLPPVSGVGMADSPDIRELMERKGLGEAYVHIDELVPVATREIACPEASGPSVLIARRMPHTTMVEPLRPPVSDAEAGLALPVGNAPMLDAAVLTGLSPQKAVCARRISHERDLWLPEHRPYAALPAPLFSAVMVVESFCEAALALHPYLTPVGVRAMRFLDMLPCPAGQHRDLKIRIADAGVENALVLVDAQMESQDVSPKGRALDQHSVNFEGRVLLAGGSPPLAPLAGFDAAGALDPASAAGPDVLLRHYETLTAQTGRYRVIENVTGTSAERIAGSMRYHLSNDVAGSSAPLRTPPYLLEALMQLVLFHGLLREGGDALGMLPVSIGSMRFARLCADGEPLALEARLRESQPAMQIWDACGSDAQGHVVMLVEGLIMRSLSKQPDQ